MTHEAYQLTNQAAQIYESQKVPAMFRPLAEATVNLIQVDAAGHVLDVACGTEILARVVGEKFPVIQRLVGSDLNQGMLDVARTLTAAERYKSEWYEADVGSLPFDSQKFSICFCQQGLQFFPDKEKALSEIHRVIKPGGRLVLSVWSEISPLFAILAEALEQHIGTAIAERSLALFAFRNQEYIENLLTGAGFTGHKIHTLTVERQIGPAHDAIPAEIAGNPVGVEVAEQGAKVLELIVQRVINNLSPYRISKGFSIPQTTFLFETRAGAPGI
jgi:ubiquinone/menaquinone biosynthesis C-methylase UbiE